MTTLLHTAAVEISRSLMAATIVKATVTLFVALIALRFTAAARAAVRHVVLEAGFAALFLLPLVSLFVPPIPMAVSVASSSAVLGSGLPSSPTTLTNRETTPEVSQEAVAQAPIGREFTVGQVALICWGVGAMIAVVPVGWGFCRVRSLRRAGVPWRQGTTLATRLAGSVGVRRQIDVLLTEGVVGPITFGVVHPAIVLPLDAERWGRDDFESAMVHELEHIRRFDWLSRTCARVVCCLYWFHPLVWVAFERLDVEAERACDDAVLQHTDPTQYADQLLGLARRLSGAQRSSPLAMANRADLAVRVRALLNERQERGRAGALVVTVASCAALAVTFAISPLRVVAAAGVPQDSASQPTFATVSIKPCATGRGRGGGGQTVSPGRILQECTSPLGLVQEAYLHYANGKINPPWTALPRLIQGAPDWMKNERYTVQAVTAGQPSAAMMLGPMMQAVLEDRFKLKVHHDNQEMPVYELRVAKGGLKIAPFQAGTCVPVNWSLVQAPPLDAGQRFCKAGWSMDAGKVIWDVEAMSLDEFAAMFRGFVDRPLVNATGSTGLFKFRLEYVQGASDDSSGSTAFAAMKDQLGIEAKSAKGRVDFLVIDHAERPTPDGPSPSAVR